MKRNNVDCEYQKLLCDIMENGVEKNTRSGKVISVFDRNLSFNLNDGFPLLTTKKMFTRGIIHELLWFLKGETNIKYLVDNNVHIWDDDAYRYYVSLAEKDNIVRDKFGVSRRDIETKETFLKMVSLSSQVVLKKITKDNMIVSDIYVYGDLGDIYGKQWRRFGISGKDQIKSIITTLLTNPNDRRLLCVAYNPDVLDEVALPPCHVMFQFYARPLSNSERFTWLQENSDNKYDEYKSLSNDKLDDLNVPKYELSIKWIQRSVDTFLGLPFNITSYSLLLCMIAQCVNMTVGKVCCSLGDCHIYESHLKAVEELISRDPLKYNLPTLKINPSVKDIDSFKIDDFEFVGYESFPSIKAPLCVG